MIAQPPAVAQARVQADAARARLLATLAEVQDRIKPSHLAQDAVESATQGIASVARKGRDAARRRPLAAAAIAAAIGLIMARHKIGDIVTGRNETPNAPEGLEPEAAPAASKG